MIVTFNFKILGAPIYINIGGEIQEDGCEVIGSENYDWEVPQEIINERIRYLLEYEYEINLNDSCFNFIGDLDIWDDIFDAMEYKYENEIEEYIRDYYEDEAYEDYLRDKMKGRD